MKTVLAWSAGKDSTATGILAKLHNIKIDEIVTVMPDPFRDELILLDKFEKFMGMKVTVIPGPSFEEFFYRVKVRGKYKGTIYGWPFMRSKICAGVMKINPMKNYFKGEEVKFLLGIAVDETNRYPNEPNESLLIKYNYTEEQAKQLCIYCGLLNPLYAHFKRLGCVRCPKQGKEALEKVSILEPEKFKWMKENDKYSLVTFKPKKTFTEFIADFDV